MSSKEVFDLQTLKCSPYEYYDSDDPTHYPCKCPKCGGFLRWVGQEPICKKCGVDLFIIPNSEDEETGGMICALPNADKKRKE